MVSYPARDVLSFVKYAYQTISSRVLETESQDEGRLLADLLQDLAFRDGDASYLEPTLSEFRIALWHNSRMAAALSPRSCRD